MRLNSVAAITLLAGSASTVAAKNKIPPTPKFTPSKITGEFVEQFTEGWEERWKPSHAKKETAAGGEEWAYVGEWAVEEPTEFPGMEGDAGLVVKKEAAHHAISAKFPKAIDNTGKTLVVQYEVKLQNFLDCGGAYLKLLRDTKSLHQDEFSNATPYVIMFGPDKCGSSNKVHFIFNHKNPKTAEYEEKHVINPPQARIIRTSELYTLAVFPNNTYRMEHNGIFLRGGSLLEDFTPSVNPPKEIDDPEDKKPEDWVEESRIPDPEATKPEDWDEDAPFEIVDEDAVKPEDWLDDEPLSIPDPEAQKPEDWDDEEDGDWVAPTVPNPKCSTISGCGPWTKPLKKNPDFKGKWNAPIIPNPAYKGAWEPRKIANPDYYEDEHPSNLEPIGAIGFELWTMQNGILFDNIYIGHSVEEARKFADETFYKKHPVEVALEKASKPSTEEEEPTLMEDPVKYLQTKLDRFLTLVAKDPVEAIKTVPEVPAAVGAVIVLLLGGLFALTGSAPAAAKPTGKKPAATESKDKDEAKASTTGAEASKEGATKRATRSQS